MPLYSSISIPMPGKKSGPSLDFKVCSTIFKYVRQPTFKAVQTLSITQVTIAGFCRDAGALFYCGAAQQIGSAFGALTAFLLVTQVTMVRVR